MKEVLHVGCGKATIKKMTAGFQQGWREVRFDINPNVNPDIVGTTVDMTGVASESVDAVYSSHNIEHVYAHQIGKVLSEFWRVLKSDGFLVVTCPNIQYVAEFIAKGQLDEPLYTSSAGPISALDILYGHGKAIENGEEYMAHRTAFTDSTLKKGLNAARFATIGVRKHRLDLWAIATKTAVHSDVARRLMNEYLPPRDMPAGAPENSR
ncbi:class I SAM-dependent methyltransferase [Sphingomonas sp. SRS2]|uniref:class I SAM-dependent methyltransferase n=1 Tax=Sphingomonas sp. SRS2 TaxID=133190 RepID=UPI0009FFB22D|nr:methyltransferase domain-containing protein [Sphingomonas sp. SRS2]